jgi:hypothetical protein
MAVFPKWTLVILCLVVLWAGAASADQKTVCTITVNSSDEKDVFQQNLPQEQFKFVELVHRGRPDWLAAACHAGVRCDVLIISGHFDSGTEFYSDRLGVREFLGVDELERASCSDSCPGLFSQLKQVYLFGCNTLNADPSRSASAEIARSLIRSGHSPSDAQALSRDLNERYGESNRDRIRQIFKDVPVIYGFSAKAPLGRSAAPILERYFRSGAASEVGTGSASAKLLRLFAPSSMTVTDGVAETDPGAAFRREACHFADDRLSSADKVDFIHQLLDGEMAEVRMFFDSIEKYVGSLDEFQRRAPELSAALQAIARDELARGRFLDFARDADELSVRARMLELAHTLGWLSPAEKRSEMIRMFRERIAQDRVGLPEVDLACSLNEDGALGQELRLGQRMSAPAGSLSNAALLACLGGAEGHARMLNALTSSDDEDVQVARVYFGHRPLADPNELHEIAAGITRMEGSDAQVHALETLANQRRFDSESLAELTTLFAVAKSIDVQRAIANILIRSDTQAIVRPDLVRLLRQHRLNSPDGEDVIDVLIRYLQAS